MEKRKEFNYKNALRVYHSLFRNHLLNDYENENAPYWEMSINEARIKLNYLISTNVISLDEGYWIFGVICSEALINRDQEFFKLDNAEVTEEEDNLTVFSED